MKANKRVVAEEDACMGMTSNMLKYLIAGVISCLLIASSHADESNIIESRFTGTSNLSDWLISYIDAAQEDIKVMVFIFEWEPIADALIRAKARGCSVEVITDRRSTKIPGQPSKTIPAPRRLREGGVSVFIYSNEPHIMHHKAVIIDGNVLFVGSYNFQKAATEGNYENLLLTKDKKAIADFEREYLRVREVSVSGGIDAGAVNQSIFSWSRIRIFLSKSWIEFRNVICALLFISLCMNAWLLYKRKARQTC